MAPLPSFSICPFLFQFCDVPHSPPLPFCATYTHDQIPTKLINSAFNENRVMHCPTLLALFLLLFTLLYLQKAK